MGGKGKAGRGGGMEGKGRAGRTGQGKELRGRVSGFLFSRPGNPIQIFASIFFAILCYS